MDNVISRQAALTEIRKDGKWLEEQGVTSMTTHERELRDTFILREMPSAQQWIPCSERLPPELKPVNVTWINRQPPTYYEKIKDKPFTDTAVYYEGKWYWQSVLCVDMLKEYGESPADDVAHEIEIVAWMPLPEPYKGEANG